ncbi:MAG: DNA-processing protein DprA [Oscillospiraceae bacterium]|jgi:DNA processing protein|nr:DNA-processing protein DprA [Oscillospiraceae bacterium]
MSSLKYWAWLSSLEGIGAKMKGDAIRQLGSAERVFFAREDELRRIPDIKQSEVRALCDKDLRMSNYILAKCQEIGCRLLTISDAEYPSRLRNIFDPPIVLYLRGTLPVIDEEPVVGIVGTRSCTPYGLRVAEDVGFGLAKRGLIVTTGMAKGVDTASALGALRGGGRVIGVLGGGIDVTYPRENAGLFEDVAVRGALISEYPPGTEPIGGHFPVRNRIISGISLGVAVIEAPLRSGALITASRALEQGRDVFSLPGNVDSSSSAGTNRLLQEGAIPILGAQDIAREYEALFPDKISVSAKNIPLDKNMEQRLVKAQLPDKRRRDSTKLEIDNGAGVVYIDHKKAAEALAEPDRSIYLAVADLSGAGGAYLDDIVARTEMPAGELLAALTMLELDGLVRDCGGGLFTTAQD